MDTNYLAGLFDGEGTFSIQVDMRRSSSGKDSVRFNPRMSMTIKYGKEVLLEYVEAFGGTIYEYPDQGEYRWNLGTRKELLVAANQLLPHLRIKKKIAGRFIEALEIFPEKRASHRLGERSWTEEMVNKVAYIALTLNPDSARKSPKTIEYLKELEKIYAN